MGTLTSFIGGGGGGGDPQGTFQANATITNGDLVALNTNGTVEPVSSTLLPADNAQSNDGTRIVTAEPYYYNGPGIFAVHDATLDKYLFVASQGSNREYQIKYGTYDDGTGEYTLTSGTSVGSMRAGWLSEKYTIASSYLWAWHEQSSGQKWVRGVYWNGSAWVFTNEVSFGYSLNDNSNYISANGDGSSDYAIASFDTSTRFCVSKGTWNGTSSTPVATQSLATTERTYASIGSAWDPNFSGTHVKGDIHVFALAYNYNSLDTIFLVTANVGQSSTTFRNNDTQLSTAPGYQNSIAYDPLNNIGIVVGRNSSSSNISLGAFSIDQNTAEITYHGDLASELTAPSGATVTFSPHTNKFVIHGWDTPTLEMFSVTSEGVIYDRNTFNVHPTNPADMRGTELFPINNSNHIGVNFTLQNNPGGNYLTTFENGYATQVGIPFVETNVDSYFGQATEDIASGSAGPIAMSQRERDLVGENFQKGQKLFADSSGSSLATSGTYRVGYAKDSDTVIITGDPS